MAQYSRAIFVPRCFGIRRSPRRRPAAPLHAFDSAREGFQGLEDLAAAYWYSEVLFAALELALFDGIESGHQQVDDLARKVGCLSEELGRLLRALGRIGLIRETGGRWVNSPAARRFLVSGSGDYMGDFLLYRRYIQPRWSALADRISRPDRPRRPRLTAEDDYRIRNEHYVQAMDRLIRRKSLEIAQILAREAWCGPVLDVGGGAGSLGRAILATRRDAVGVLLDLSEVIEAGRRIHPDSRQWERILPVAGDFRHHPFRAGRFGLVVMSNFLHVYARNSARELLGTAVSLLRPDGMLLIHDYFPDRTGSRPHKGALYDLNMMLNTCEGVCHESREIAEWLAALGIPRVIVRDLATDTSLILAGRLPGRPREVPAKSE